MAALRERVQPAEDDLLDPCSWAGEKKGALPERTVLLACGQLRLHIAQKYNDRHKLLDPEVFKFLWVVDFPDVRMGRRGQPMERRAPSVHIGSR